MSLNDDATKTSFLSVLLNVRAQMQEKPLEGKTSSNQDMEIDPKLRSWFVSFRKETVAGLRADLFRAQVD